MKFGAGAKRFRFESFCAGAENSAPAPNFIKGGGGGGCDVKGCMIKTGVGHFTLDNTDKIWEINLFYARSK